MKNLKNTNHKCKDYFYGCTCSVIGLEPQHDCDVHGSGHWPPRCSCGKFIKREVQLLGDINENTTLEHGKGWS